MSNYKYLKNRFVKWLKEHNFQLVQKSKIEGGDIFDLYGTHMDVYDENDEVSCSYLICLSLGRKKISYQIMIPDEELTAGFTDNWADVAPILDFTSIDEFMESVLEALVDEISLNGVDYDVVIKEENKEE